MYNWALFYNNYVFTQLDLKKIIINWDLPQKLQRFLFRQSQVNSMPVAFSVDMRFHTIIDADSMVDEINPTLSPFYSLLDEACQD